VKNINRKQDEKKIRTEGEESNTNWRILYSEELYNFYSLLNVDRVIESRGTKWRKM
jgi:hypothetical protein